MHIAHSRDSSAVKHGTDERFATPSTAKKMPAYERNEIPSSECAKQRKPGLHNNTNISFGMSAVYDHTKHLKRGYIEFGAV